MALTCVNKHKSILPRYNRETDFTARVNNSRLRFNPVNFKTLGQLLTFRFFIDKFHALRLFHFRESHFGHIISFSEVFRAFEIFPPNWPLQRAFYHSINIWRKGFECTFRANLWSLKNFKNWLELCKNFSEEFYHEMVIEIDSLFEANFLVSRSSSSCLHWLWIKKEVKIDILTKFLRNLKIVLINFVTSIYQRTRHITNVSEEVGFGKKCFSHTIYFVTTVIL